MSALTRAIAPLVRECHLVFLYWARCEIDPLHPDVPYIVRTIARLEAKRGSS